MTDYRLRATVTHTVEYEPNPIHYEDWIPDPSMREMARIDAEALRDGEVDIADIRGAFTEAVRVEVVR